MRVADDSHAGGDNHVHRHNRPEEVLDREQGGEAYAPQQPGQQHFLDKQSEKALRHFPGLDQDDIEQESSDDAMQEQGSFLVTGDGNKACKVLCKPGLLASCNERSAESARDRRSV